MWDMTVVYSTADFYIDITVQGPGCVGEMAASRKEAKNATLQTHYDFQPIAVETQGPISESATSVRFGSANFSHERGGQRASVFVSSLFNAFQSPTSALTRCFYTTVFFVVRPPGLVSVPDFNFLY